jgi:Lrp/AsnC family leucine-responsive transcriptional regulator
VVSCYVTSGGDDFMVEVAAQDLADYERLLLDQILAIPAVVQARSTFAIRTVLSRGPVPLAHWR